MDLRTQSENEPNYDALVGRVFRIEAITRGDMKKDHFLVRYTGRLVSEDSAAAYDQMAELLLPYNITPLFRWEGDQQAVLLTPSGEKPKPSNPRINLWLFILTLISVLVTGALYGLQDPLPADTWEAAKVLLNNAWPFAVSILLILGTHELGHYFMGRYHGVHVTLPYFIPFPLSPLGTMGAFINMKEQPKNRRHLLDIGAAGPLAGLAVAIPILYIGLTMSKIGPLPVGPSTQSLGTMEGSSVLYLLMKYLAFGRILPTPAIGAMPMGLFWLRYFFTGTPFPYGGEDVLLSGVAWAGWGGILVTGLNLIPAGQLDGGHLFYVLFGRNVAQRLRPVILGVLVLLGVFWMGWWIWALLIFVFGRFYAEPLDQITPLDGKRKAVAILGLVVFLLTFTPIPMLGY